MQSLHLGQNLKFQKTCQNLFHKSFTVLCKKKLEKKNSNGREMRQFLKIDHQAKAIDPAKSSIWVKIKILKKHVKIHSTNDLQLLCAKNRWKKDQIFEK